MTANERLEKLLNRAGQTISDLPTRSNDPEDVFPYTVKQRLVARDTALRWLMLSRHEVGLVDEARAMCIYILHLSDVIDRMETALENVIGERDWLRANYSANPNETVPEDWRADDGLEDGGA